MFDFYYFLETYIVNCSKANGTKCTISPSIPANIDLTLTDIISTPDTGGVSGSGGVSELTLSADLAMFFAYLLRFIIFHGLGILLCYFCTISFRASSRR